MAGDGYPTFKNAVKGLQLERVKRPASLGQEMHMTYVQKGGSQFRLHVLQGPRLQAIEGLGLFPMPETKLTEDLYTVCECL